MGAHYVIIRGDCECWLISLDNRSRHFLNRAPPFLGTREDPGFFEALGAIRVLNAAPLQPSSPPPLPQGHPLSLPIDFVGS
jgi:hypothetical protein